MKIHGLLSWFDEDPTWLASAIKSFAPIIDSLVAVDGRYALYESNEVASAPDQYGAILGTCRSLGLPVTIHAPFAAWEGNEVEKRTALFRLGESVAGPEDWYCVIDADEFVVQYPPNLRDILAETEQDSAQVLFLEEGKDDLRVPILFRAIPGLHVETNHYTYRTPDGRYLWGNTSHVTVEQALDLSDGVQVRHLTHHRRAERKDRQKAYYNTRKEAAVEASPCWKCKAKRGIHTQPHPKEWERHRLGLASGWVEVCGDCREAVAQANEDRIRELGFDPNNFLIRGNAAHLPPPNRAARRAAAKRKKAKR
jgi:sulfur relay (sulfurtransferase) complex TusBCD TusD component (DsrE family)